MTLDAAFLEIHRFWPDAEAFAAGDKAAAARLAAAFRQELPAELVTYLTGFVPAQDVEFDTVGNPLRLYGADSLGPQQPGYNWDETNQTPLSGWNSSFFLLADEGADPVVLDLTQPAAGLQKLLHGAGSWHVGETVAATIGQFILCSAALHHALTAFEPEPIIDDDKGFNLAPQAAAWLFPRLRKWAGAYYSAWSGIFDNA